MAAAQVMQHGTHTRRPRLHAEFCTCSRTVGRSYIKVLCEILNEPEHQRAYDLGGSPIAEWVRRFTEIELAPRRAWIGVDMARGDLRQIFEVHHAA